MELARRLFDDIRAFCVERANPTLASRWARYFVEGYDAYGVDHKAPDWDARLRAWTERVRGAGPDALFALGDLLVRTGKYEEASFAILIARDLPEFDAPESFARLATWFDGGIRNWGHTDVLCGEVLTRYLRNGTVGLDALVPWRDSPHKYQRRAVPVMLIGVLDHYRTFAPLFKLIEPLMKDPEKVVQQGTGWFLREAWKRRAKETEAFLGKHKETAPRLIIQYATEKMDKAERGRYRRSRG